MEFIKALFQIDDGTLFSDGAVGVYWNPLLLLLVGIVISILVYLFGKIFFRNDYNKDTDQVKPFNSGNLEEINYSVGSSNLYWGFKSALKKYYQFVESLHKGDLNDYLKWLIITIAVCLVLVNGGIL